MVSTPGDIDFNNLQIHCNINIFCISQNWLCLSGKFQKNKVINKNKSNLICKIYKKHRKVN